jgi:hypothetical protein
MAMKNAVLKLAMALSLFFSFAIASHAQQPSKSDAPTKNDQATDDQEKNLQTYVDLLRSDVKAEKVQILSVMMSLSPDQASTFWPIYKNYDADLTKLGDEKLALIKDYAANYDSMTDAKADELVERSFTLGSDRNALLKQTYEQVKNKIGAREAARFVQIENQLLMIIDLQIASQLPAVK